MWCTKLALLGCVSAQFGSLFEQMFQQQQQRPQKANNLGSNPIEKAYHEVQCDQYLCSDSLTCVSSPLECPCPFPDSQIKCVYPDNSAYVCFSAPSEGDGPDCAFLLDAFNGKV